MAKLYFRYGAMGSSKSANILMVRYNYEERGQYAVLLKPRTDNRDGEHEIKSRIGLEAPAEYVDWVYVLPEARHKGVAQGLFQEMEKDCRKHGINQYYLIRATNPNADKFYHSFENAELDEEPFLRKELKE